MDIFKDLAMYIVTGMVAVIAWFLRSKDEAQARQIALLFSKHDEDAARLADLEIRIAKEHYLKHELDQRFDRVETAVKTGLLDVGTKIDKLTQTMIDHIAKGTK